MDTKALRQKILDLAICGKLVPQDPNDEPASVLLERIREQKKQMVKEGKLKAKDIKNDSIIFVGEDSLHYEKFADGSVKCIEDEIPFELPEGWSWARIFSIAEDLPYGTAKKSLPTGLVAVLRMGNIQSGEIDYSDIVYSSDGDDIVKYTLIKNDLLFNRTNSAEWVGKTAIYRGNIPAIYAGYLIRIRTFINAEYLNVVMNSGYAKSYCNSVKTDGVNQSNINAQKLGNFLIPIPSFSEQHRISSSIADILPRISIIQDEKDYITDLIQKMKSKILDLAIRGQLVPQNPDDEPASVLLEHIRAEKEELIKRGKIKRDKKESIIFKGEDNSYYETINGQTECIDDELPFEVPDNWEWVRLSSVLSLSSGKSIKVRQLTDEGDFPVYGGNGINGLHSEYNVDSDTIIIGRVGYYCGSVYKTEAKSWVTDNALIATIKEPYIFNIDFLVAILKYLDLGKTSVSTAQPVVSGKGILPLIVPVPPITEQNLINNTLQKINSHILQIELELL